MAEVEMIERAREKRRWQSSLPPIEDENGVEERIRLLEEQEAREWAVREAEIEQLQRERLELLKQLLAQRDETRKAELTCVQLQF